MLPLKNPIGLALAGLAAFAAYKYSKMTDQQRKDLANTLKEKGRKIFGSLVPAKSGVDNNQTFQGTNYTG